MSQVPAVYVGRNASLSAFSAGRSSALVCDSGGASTSVVPVFDGYVLQKSLSRSRRGGIWLTAQLAKLLERSSISVRPRYAARHARRVGGVDGDFGRTHASYARYFELDAVREMKEEVCLLPRLKLDKREIAALIPPGQAYELPDGTRVEVRRLPSFQCPAQNLSR